MSDIEIYFADLERIWEIRLYWRKKNIEFNNRKKKSSGKKSGLISKVKKIETFLKKLKQFEKQNVDSLVREMKKLKLSLYLEEIVSNICAVCTEDMTSVHSLMHFISEVHLSLDFKFTNLLKTTLLQVFKNIEFTSDDANAKQLRNLKILIEMHFMSLLDVHDSKSLLINLLKHIIRHSHLRMKLKIESNVNRRSNSKTFKAEDEENEREISQLMGDNDIVLIHTFNLLRTWLEIASDECFACTKYSNMKPRVLHEIFTNEERKQFIHVFCKFYDRISVQFIEYEYKLRVQMWNNNRILIQRGDLSEIREQITARLQSLVNCMTTNITIFCNYLNENVKYPTLKIFNAKEMQLNIDGNLTTMEDAKQQSYFDDEDTRLFYEQLPDLKAIMPGSLLLGDNEISDNEYEPTIAININMLQTHDQLSDIHNMSQLLSKLSIIGSRKDADICAEKFCVLNSKSNRKLLVKFLFDISEEVHYRIPFLCRFVCILQISGINIGDRLCLKLDKDFYRFVCKQRNNSRAYLVNEKLKILSYIAELTKFAVFSHESVMKMLFILLKQRLSPDSIQLLTYLLCECGRYLYLHPLTHLRLHSILLAMQRNKNLQNLNEFSQQNIMSAVNCCKPAQMSALITIKEKNDIHKFMEYLIFVQLKDDNKQQILKCIRKMPWNEEYIHQCFSQILLNVHNIDFTRIKCIAAICQGLNAYLIEFTHLPFDESNTTTCSSSNNDAYVCNSVYFMDAICEQIREDMEEEDETQDQRRLSQMKLLGELYTYKVCGSQIIFDTLYLLITLNIDFQHLSLILFRLQMCCMLLETCGRYLGRGKLKARCQRFLLFFRRFVLVIEVNQLFEVPLEIQWWMDDVFLMLRCTNFQQMKMLSEVENAINLLDNAHRDALLTLDTIDIDTESVSLSSTEHDMKTDEETAAAAVIKDEYDCHRKMTADDNAFLKEYQKMISKSMTSVTKKCNLQNLRHASVLIDDDTHHANDDDDDGNENEVAYRVISRKNKKRKNYIGNIRIPRTHAMITHNSSENTHWNGIKSVTLLSIAHYEMQSDSEDESESEENNAWTAKGRKTKKHYSQKRKKKHLQKKKKIAKNKKQNKSSKNRQAFQNNELGEQLV